MDKKEIKKLYNSKVNLLKKYNESYFDKNKSIVSDKEYDEIKKEVLDFEKKFSYLVSKYSPSQIVGFKPSKNFKKSIHTVPMLSLGNAFSEEDLINFEKKITNYLSIKNEACNHPPRRCSHPASHLRCSSRSRWRMQQCPRYSRMEVQRRRCQPSYPIELLFSRI